MKQLLTTLVLATMFVPALASAEANVVSRGMQGTPNFVTGDLGQVDMGMNKALGGAEAADTLRGLLMTHFDAVGDEGLEQIATRTDDLGNVYLRFQQTYNGLPVVGAQMLMHVEGDSGAVFAVTGDFAPGVDLPFSPAIGAVEAFDGPGIPLKGFQIASDAQLTYVLVEGQAHLAWQRAEEYESAKGPHHDLVFVDAMTGLEIARHAKVYYARNLVTYDCNNGTVQNGCTQVASSSSNTINTGDNAIDSAHNFAVGTYNYYFNNFGRDSLNNGGMTLLSNVHFDTNYNNAFWFNGEMTYGDGDGTTFVPLSQDADVVGHELTHGVTEFTSNLIYNRESGALNESMSDIFGALIDRQEGATGGDIWKIGEDIYTPGTSGDALRYMANPTQDGYSTDYYPTRLYPGSCFPSNANDQCGVHGNSGISNLAFKLLVTGGTHPQGTTSNTVPSLGYTVAGKIFYEANTNCLTASSNFEAARNCTAAKALAFYGATEEAAVHEAWDAVGVPGGPGGPPPGGGGCSNTNIWTGTASSGTPNLTTPNCSASGTFNGELSCDNGAADLDLYLEKETCSGWFGCSFGTVASSTSAGCDENVTGYSGSSGTYRWRINWYSGPAEPFHLCTNKC